MIVNRINTTVAQRAAGMNNRNAVLMRVMHTASSNHPSSSARSSKSSSSSSSSASSSSSTAAVSSHPSVFRAHQGKFFVSPKSSSSSFSSSTSSASKSSSSSFSSSAATASAHHHKATNEHHENDHHSPVHGHHHPTPKPNRQFSSLIQQQVGEYARQPQQGVTIRQLLAVGPKPTKEALLASAQFLHKELPIRLAKRVKELESLPYGLSQLAPVLKVRDWYVQSFRDLLSGPAPTNEAEELAFTNLLDIIYNRHTDVVPTLAQGVLQMKKELGSSGPDVVNQCPFLQDFLNRFHSSRIGIRLLISQHIAIHQPMEGYIGTIATNISPIGVIRDAICDAARICDRQYGWAPEVNVIGDETKVINFVPDHLHHILFELLKNSMRAVIEHHGLKNYDCPAIQVILTDDEREFAIKIGDQGGGIPRQDMHRIWSYLYTTTNPTSTEDLLSKIQAGGGDNSKRGPATEPEGNQAEMEPSNPINDNGPAGGTPMSGFGYGLPISRLYASYFGGDLNIVSVDGYGTDAFLYLNKLGDFNLFLE